MALAPKVRAMAAVLTLSASGLAFIKGNEDTRNTPYLDSVGVPTVCTGHTASVNLRKYYTDAECDALLDKDTHWAVQAVRKSIRVPLYQSQFDTLVDFCFQYGAPKCQSSTLFRLINQEQHALAAEQFARWKFADDKDCSVRKNDCYGVILRQVKRKELYLSDL